MKYEDLSSKSRRLIDKAIESKVYADQCDKLADETGEAGWVINVKFADGQVSGYLEAVELIEDASQITVEEMFKRRLKEIGAL